MANDALMWEVRCPPGKQEELLAWVREHAVPVLDAAGCRDFGLYRCVEDRVVVIAHFPGRPVELPEPPDYLTARPAHQWHFERVR